MRVVRWPDLGHGRDDLRPPPNAADCLVRGLLDVRPQKDGMSALSLQRSLEIGSYPTAWAMLHRLRAVLVRPGRDRLTGTVEVDETCIGGEEPGLRGGRGQGEKALVGAGGGGVETAGTGPRREGD